MGNQKWYQKKQAFAPLPLKSSCEAQAGPVLRMQKRHTSPCTQDTANNCRAMGRASSAPCEFSLGLSVLLRIILPRDKLLTVLAGAERVAHLLDGVFVLVILAQKSFHLFLVTRCNVLNEGAPEQYQC